jgi:hypothetical protein
VNREDVGGFGKFVRWVDGDVERSSCVSGFLKESTQSVDDATDRIVV